MTWDKFKTIVKNILKLLAIPFVVLGTFFLKAFMQDRYDKTKEQIKNLEKETQDLKKKTDEAKEDLSKKQDQLDKSIDRVEKTVDELKTKKEERDKSAEQFFK